MESPTSSIANPVLAIQALAKSVPPRAVGRVLLLYPFSVSRQYNVASVLADGHFVEAPIGLGYIASFLKKYVPGVEVEVFDANAMALKHIQATGRAEMDELFALLRGEVEKRRPDVIGISCLFDSIAPMAHRHVALARAAVPDAVIVMGGNYPTGVPDVALSDEELDFVIFSEGEEAFAKLVLALQAGVEPSAATSGIAYRPARVHARLAAGSPAPDRVVAVPKGPMVETIDDFPVPDRSGFDMDFYATRSRHTIFRTLPKSEVRLATLTASRGCPFKCTFCSSKDFWGQTIRYRDARLVVDEMRMLQSEHGINTFVFNDDNIMYDRKYILALCDEIKRRNLSIHWMSGGGIQVSAMKPDVIQAVVETGLKQFNLAIETGNPATLRRIKKPLVKGVAESVIAEIRKYEGTWIASNFITGFYFETRDDVEETLAYAGSLDLDWRCIYSFQPLRGTEDYQTCVKLGYVKESHREAGMRPGTEDSGVGVEVFELSTENFTAEEVRNRNYEANLLHNFVNNRNYALRPAQVIRDVQYVIEMVPDHALGHYALGRSHLALGDRDRALADFERARQLVEASRSLRANSFHSLFALIDASVRWADYFEKFGIDIDAEIRRARTPA